MPHNSTGIKETFTTTVSELERQKEAKNDELKKLEHYDVYEYVKDEGQNTISCRWIITNKTDNDCVKFKARLVARGFEETLLKLLKVRHAAESR